MPSWLDGCSMSRYFSLINGEFCRSLCLQACGRNISNVSAQLFKKQGLDEQILRFLRTSEMLTIILSLSLLHELCFNNPNTIEELLRGIIHRLLHYMEVAAINSKQELFFRISLLMFNKLLLEKEAPASPTPFWFTCWSVSTLT